MRLAGYEALTADLVRAAREQGAGFLASEDYGTASLLAWFAPGPVLGAEARWRLFTLPAAATAAPGLLLLSVRRREPPDPAFWDVAEPVGAVARSRGGVEVEHYRLYRVLPRPGATLVRLPSRVRTSDAQPDP